MNENKIVELGIEVYRLVKKLPPEEKHVLAEMLMEATGELAANIKMTKADLPQEERAEFLSAACGKIAVVETLLTVCVKLNYLADAEVATALNACAELGRMLKQS